MSGPQPLQRRAEANGISLCIFEWGRELAGRDDSILLTHATGFHARCWDRVVHFLGERHVIAVDQRGHGRSDKTGPIHWQVFGADLGALICALDLKNIVGVGHSMGGHATTQAAAAHPERFRRLVLVDPVIGPPDAYGDGGDLRKYLNGESHPTAKRRNQWRSAAEMYERFKGRPPFSAFDPAALRDYCEYGLLPDSAGEGLVLACPPEFEAEVYMTSRSWPGIYDCIHAVEAPVLILRAMEPPAQRDLMDFRSSPTWPGLVREFKRAREVYFPDRTHFLPMEDPALVAGYIAGTAWPPPHR